MNSEINASGNQLKHNLNSEFSEEQISEIEKLSALDYSTEEMAVYFDIPLIIFKEAAENIKHKLNYYIKRGKLISTAKEKMNLLDSAESGNISASAHLNIIRRFENFAKSRKHYIYDDEKDYSKLYAYIEKGCTDDLTEHEEVYLEILTMMNSMRRKYGERKTIAFFTKPPFSLSPFKIRLMYNKAIEYFYADLPAEKKALRNLRADMILEAASVVLANAQSAKDYEIYANMISQASKLQQLDQIDLPEIPIEAYLKPIIIYTLDPMQLGMSGIDRDKLAAQIDEIENIPASVKRRAKQDAFIEDINFEEIIDELQEESKNK